MTTAPASSAATQSQRAPPPAGHLYRLYVSAGSPVSSRAIANARQFFESHLPGAHRLVVLNIAEHVALAQADQIIASPTLLRIEPQPRLRVIGDMADTARLARALGMPRPPGAGAP